MHINSSVSLTIWYIQTQTIIALTRDPTSPSSQSLATLPIHPSSRLIVIKYDASIESDAFDAIAEIQNTHGIRHLDIVIANAGIAKSYPLVKDVRRDDILEHVNVNVLAVVSLFQASRELLRKAIGKKEPVFAILGSGAGALGYVGFYFHILLYLASLFIRILI